MGKILKLQKEKLIIGLIYKDTDVKDNCLILLKDKFGPIDFTSETLDFNLTDYYSSEFGLGLKRTFLSFKPLIKADTLSIIKLYTNKLERKLGIRNKRRINIDPGFLSLGKLILATTKDRSHRIYIGKGIFAEITLSYEKKSFRPQIWTYPDYRTGQYIDIFNRIRNIYYSQISKNSSFPSL